MAGYRIDYSNHQALSTNSVVYAGAKLYVYDNTTTTLKTLYSDRAVAVTAANPIVADSAGRLPVRYVAADDLLTLTLKTSADVTIWSNDDQEPVPSVDNADLALYVPLAGVAPMIGPFNMAEGAAVASAATINLDAATGNLVHITGTTPITAITLAAGYHRWLVFDDALTLTHSVNLILQGSANITTVAGDSCLLIGEGGGVVRMLDYRLIDGRALVESADMLLSVTDETTNITAGVAKITFRMPYAMTLTSIPRGSLSTVQSAGSLLTVDINEGGASILSTKLTWDNSESSTSTAATPAVLSDTAMADNAEITVDIDTVGTAGARGMKLQLIGTRRNR